MKKIILSLVLCAWVFITQLHAQTEVTMYVNTNKNQTWRCVKLQDKRQGIESLAAKLLKANKDGLLQAYYLAKNNKLKTIAYRQVAKNMELPQSNGLSNFFLKDIKGATISNYQKSAYINLILPASKIPEGFDFVVVTYKVADIEKLLNCKIIWKELSCETCSFDDDDNTVKPFVANPSMPEFEPKTK
ncbi:MAG: hypothetical protein ACOVQA_05560 [Thermoflexibacteraceae bacterium]|jgi:hypothetical protein